MKVVTFGESLFRFATHQGERLSHAQELKFYLGGTELNIAANLASLGVSTSWVSALAAGFTGKLIQEKVKSLNVDLSHCTEISSGQAGWYLMETGASPRPDIVYHRNASSMAQVEHFHFDWNKILKDATVFHSSGVTAGLSDSLNREIEKAMIQAKALDKLVSYDFNYRKNIWSIEDFVAKQKKFLPHIDILFCGESDLDLFFSSTDPQKVFSETQLKLLVLTKRSPDETEYGLETITSDLKAHHSKRYKVTCVDRIGVGDSMAAGFLKSFLTTKDHTQACEWGALAGALKYGIKGDMALLSASEMEMLLFQAPKGILR